MGGKRIPDVALRAREVEVARLTARKVPQALIASTLAISERQVRYDLVSFREQIAAAGSAHKVISEIYEELFRVGWQDHDKAPENDAKGARARASLLRVLVEIADRMAALSGIDLKDMVPTGGGDTYVLGDATFDQRRLEVSPDFARKVAASRDGADGNGPGGG